MRPARDALSAVPTPTLEGRAGERLAALPGVPGFVEAVTSLTPVRAPAHALSNLVDAALRSYAGRAHLDPVMLVHAVTAPAAVALALPSLPGHLHVRSVELAWTTSAAVTAAYAAPKAVPGPTPAATADDAMAEAVAHGDAHVIKLTEAAVRACDARAGLHAARTAVRLI